MKNSDLSSAVTTALEKVQDITTEISKLQKLARDSSAELAALELSVDLSDAEALAGISRLQTVAAIVPRRLDAREEALTHAQEELVQTCEAFITSSLGPRVRDLLARAEAKAGKNLHPHFKDEFLLKNAVNSSALVNEITAIQAHVTIRGARPEQAENYASELLQAWQEAAAFEKSKLN
jgi:hypothetical protein